MKNILREILITVILALIIYFTMRATIQTYVVIMSSMEPNFHEGQRVVVNKAVYWFGEPERGDVIIFESSNRQHDDFIKRVIGIPGDTVEVKDGAVYINGTRLDEPYIKSAPRYTMEKKTIPEDSYFVLGDNRNNSNDSHNFGFIKSEDIHGKAWLSTWPPSNWGIVPDYALEEQLAQADT